MSICLVPSPEFSQAPQYFLPVHLCRFAVRSFGLHHLGAFPGSRAPAASPAPKCRDAITPQNMGRRTCLAALPTRLDQVDLRLDSLAFSVPPSLRPLGTGTFTCFPSATPLGLALGADSPCADYRRAGNLGLSACGFFSRMVVTHVSIRTSVASSSPLGAPSLACRTLLYRPRKRGPVASVDSFSPVTSSAQADSTSELLRFL